MRKENQSYIGQLFSEDQISNQQVEIQQDDGYFTKTAIQWKICRDYQSKIKINIIFKVIQIDMRQFQNNEFETNQNCACSPMVQMFLEEINVFKSKLLSKENNFIDSVKVLIKNQENEKLDTHIPCINEFLASFEKLFSSFTNLKFTIDADFLWNNINFQSIIEQVKYFEINDIYSYFPLSNLKYPSLKRIFINPSLLQNNINQHSLNLNKSETISLQEIEENFQLFLSSLDIKQIEFIQIDGSLYPELIKIWLKNLFKIKEACIKRMEFHLNVDSQQFHTIFSLSNICQIYPSCQISINYIIDFSPLLNCKKRIYESSDRINKDEQQTNQQEKTNEANSIQQFKQDYPFVFKEIFKSFENNNIQLVFKNLKSLEQLEVFDKIKNTYENTLNSDDFIYQMNKNKTDDNSKIFTQLTCLVYTKVHNMNPFNDSNHQSSTNGKIQSLEQKCGDQKNQFMMNINKPFLMMFPQTWVKPGMTDFVVSRSFDSEKLKEKQNIFDSENYLKHKNQKDQSDKNEKKLKSVQLNNEKSVKCETATQQLYQQKEQSYQASYSFPFQPMSLFKSKQGFSKEQNDNNQDKQNQKQIKQFVQQQSDQSNQTLSKYFLPYQTNEITALELILENTVFGSNYKDLFDFISKCVHLKKFTLLNFCMQDNFGSQQNISQQMNQKQKTDTQQAMHVYSSVFSIQPRKTVEKVMSEFVQSLRKTTLITFKFSTNSFFSEQVALRLLQTQENLVHFYLKDFSSNVSISSLQNIQSHIISSQEVYEERQLVSNQIFASFYQTINLNKYLMSYYFKNGDANSATSNKGFQQILNFYFTLKKILLYQIYASKQLLHSEIIKRKEIFNHLITKFYLNFQSQLNQKILQINSSF